MPHRVMKIRIMLLTLSCLLGVLVHPAAHAQVVNFNVTPVTVSNGDNASFGNININNGTFELSGVAPSFTFQAGNGMMMGVYVWMAGDNSLNLAVDPSGFLAKLSSSDTIDGNWANWTSGFTNPTLLDNSSGPWFGGGTGYVGLRIADGLSYHYGVAEVTYNAEAVSLTVSDFAFQSATGIGISGAAIPEPATSAALAATLVLGVAWFRRKRAASPAPQR